MNEDIMKKWVNALRSGEYQQGRERLNQSGQFCCLGVLCDIYSKENGVPWQRVPCGSPGEMRIMDAVSFLPLPIAEWAGLKVEEDYRNIDVRVQVTSHKREYLAEMNDNGVSFSHIADLIEKNWSNL